MQHYHQAPKIKTQDTAVKFSIYYQIQMMNFTQNFHLSSKFFCFSSSHSFDCNFLKGQRFKDISKLIRNADRKSINIGKVERSNLVAKNGVIDRTIGSMTKKIGVRKSISRRQNVFIGENKRFFHIKDISPYNCKEAQNSQFLFLLFLLTKKEQSIIILRNPA